jgi:CRP-like cAMP-binding protein
MLQTDPCDQRARPGPAPNIEPSLLSGIDLLEDLGDEELTALEQACRYRRFAAQEQVIDRESHTNDVFFVVRGRVRVVNYSLLGREITFDELGEGSYFGELSALDGKPRSASVMAIEDALIVAAPGRLFMRVLEKHPKMALSVMKRLAGIVRTADDRIMDLSTLAAHNRVHAELLRQARNHMTNRNAAQIEPSPVHGNLASRVSTTRETVARVLNDLARKGIVERTRNALLIHNVDRLRDIVQEVRG